MTKTCKDCGIMLHIDFFPVFGKDKKPRPRCTNVDTLKRAVAYLEDNR